MLVPRAGRKPANLRDATYPGGRKFQRGPISQGSGRKREGDRVERERERERERETCVSWLGQGGTQPTAVGRIGALFN